MAARGWHNRLFERLVDAWRKRHGGMLLFLLLLLLAFTLDDYLLNSWILENVVPGVNDLAERAGENWETTRVAVCLPLLTIFLAFANLYMKISLQAPNIQRRLSPKVFANTSFAIYLGVYLLLAFLAYLFFFDEFEGDWMLSIAASSLLGIGIGNSDIKFGGFSLLPLAEFLQGLEGVVQAGISYNVNELDVAQRASLRDLLAENVAIQILERECRLQGVDQEKLKTLREQGAGDVGYRGLLAKTIVAGSEANAKRIIKLPQRSRFPDADAD